VGRAFQERREPIHGGFAQTSLFVTILESPPHRSRLRREVVAFMNNAAMALAGTSSRFEAPFADALETA
jgi:hypothetical protein